VHPFKKIAVPRTLSSILGLFAVLLLASPGLVLSETHAVSATIDVSKRGTPISKNIYGQFLEHGGDIVNNGVWSEMLVDRKFFYPVAATAPTPPPVIGGAGGNPRFRRTPTRWWAPIGSGNAVTMDTGTPYTGDQSPLVKLDVKDPHGISQSGIAVRKEKAYTGRIVLAGDKQPEVQVEEQTLGALPDTVVVRPFSVNIYSYPVQ